MATFNVEMRQRVSGSFSDIIYPKAHWGNIDGKPSTFAPTAHEHSVSDIDATGTPSSTTYLRGDGAWATPSVEGGGGGLNYLMDYTTTENVSEIELTNLDVTEGKRIYFNWWLKNSDTNGQSYIKVNDSSSAYRTVKNLSSSAGSGVVTQTAVNNGFSIGTVYMYNCFIEGVISVDVDKKAFISWKESYIYGSRVYQAVGSGYGDFNLTDDKISSIQFIKVNMSNSPAILAGSVLKVWEM